ncbi:LacI family DNA-binding transcriptional regulator [soil metagenome]
MTTRSTIEDVARLANVSIATVSRYTSGQVALVAPATQERLKLAIDELGYVPHAAARSLKTGRTRLIGVILADVSHAYWSSLLGGIQAGCQELGFGVLIASGNNSAANQYEYLRTYLEHGAEGILFNPAAGDARLVAEWMHVRIPVLQLDRGSPGVALPVVAVDNTLGAKIATRHLLEHGHCRIGVISWHTESLSNREERLDGFLATMHEAGFAVPDRDIALVDQRAGSASDGIATMMAQPDPPTAIFSTNMEISLEAIRFLHDAGLRVPNEVSIVGFDDPEWTSIVHPPLTAIATPSFRLGKLAAIRVCRAIRMGEPLGLHNSKLAPTLIERRSVAAPPKRNAIARRYSITKSQSMVAI